MSAKKDETDRIRLERIARETMLTRDLLPDFDRRILSEVRKMKPVPIEEDGSRRDARELLWSSIDNDDSRDLDQLTAAQSTADDRIRIYVAVAEVDALVHRGRPTDAHAQHNTTSVYTPAVIFPMLPERLSNDLTSLNESEDRPAIVLDMVVAPDGSVEHEDLYLAAVRNHAKLAYNSVGAWLEDRGALPAAAARVPGLEANLRLQHEAAQRLRRRRYERGALDLQTIQTRSVFDGDEIVGTEADAKNGAKELIEDFMIAANGVTARFLRNKQIPSLRRVVREPARWERIVELAAELDVRLPRNPDSGALSDFLAEQREIDPLRFPDLSLTVVKLMGSGEYVVEYPGETPVGHFGLAVRNYTHSTAPNRRFPDLITQRLVKAALAGEKAPYDARALEVLARHCTDKEDDADKVERRLGKSAAALLLDSQIGKRFHAIVTGASPKGTWVRTFDPHVEGMLVEGAGKVDVGDRIRVELVETDVENGYIDFKRVRG